MSGARWVDRRLDLDHPGVGETERGDISRWPREIEAVLERPALRPLLRAWRWLNSVTLETTQRVITLPRWPMGQPPLRLLHLSDLHLTAEVDPTPWLRRLAGLQVDLIAVTGDLIHDDSGRERGVRFLQALLPQARLGVFLTLGNHDYLGYGVTRLPNGHAVQHRWLNDVAALRGALAAAGVVVLDNTAQPLGKSGLWIAGVGDPYTGHDDMAAALRAVPSGAAVVLLAHSPDQLPAAAARGVDLMLGGHTHGGQVRIPFVGPLMTATLLPLRLVSGYAVYRGARCYISRGLGTASMPLRVFCRPEAALLTLGPLPSATG